MYRSIDEAFGYARFIYFIFILKRLRNVIEIDGIGVKLSGKNEKLH